MASWLMASGWPVCPYLPCSALDVAGRAHRLPPWPLLVLPDAPEGSPQLPSGFSLLGGADALFEASALHALPLQGLPAASFGAARLVVAERASRWLSPQAIEVLRSSAQLRSAIERWSVGETVYDLSARPLVMGIVNVTPDSFSDGGAFATVERAVAHGRRLVAEGADVVDVGGESTRPGSQGVALEEELARVVPVVRALAAELAVPVSIDTRKAAVARACIEAGAQIVNDISALGEGRAMAEVVASSGASLVLMHMRGEPATMQDDTSYADLFGEIVDQLEESLLLAYDTGIDLRRVLVDPGIGFGKRLEQNLDLVVGMDRMLALGRAGLLGPSRKRFLGELTGRPVTERDSATVAAVTAGVLAGAGVVRVHDVAACVDGVRVATALRRRLVAPSRPLSGSRCSIT